MSTKYQAWLNGEVCLKCHAFDRGLHYGDGFFTSILAYQGRLLNWSAHWHRLTQSAKRLAFPALEEAEILTDIQPALAAMQQDFAVIKLMLTRGLGAGYAPPKAPQIQRWVFLSQAPGLAIEFMPKIHVIRCQTPVSENAKLAGIKHLNRLDNVLARAEVETAQADEGLMLNQHQHVICGTQGNLVILREGKLCTPTLECAGVEGTCLRTLQSLSLGLEWQVCDLTWQDVVNAQAAFICNAVRGVQVIERLESHLFDGQLIQPIHQAWWSYNLT